MTLLDQEIKNGGLAAKSIVLTDVKFTRADGTTATISGSVDVYATGQHDVLISDADIMRLRMSLDEFDVASAAVSKAAFADSIINLTQHSASDEQIAAGVVEPADKKAVQDFLDFPALPSRAQITTQANVLAAIAHDSGCRTAMIGGAPFFMTALESALKSVGIKPVYAFSVRESVESVVDGKTVKTAVFKHLGFVEA